MGFCLFEIHDKPRQHFAVNASCVRDVIALDADKNLSRILLPPQIDFIGFDPVIRGTPQDVLNFIKRSVSIGTQKASVHILSGSGVMKPLSTLINQTHRIVLVREVELEDLKHDTDQELRVTTASKMYMEGGRMQMIEERPGVFASLVNAAVRVPLFQTET